MERCRAVIELKLVVSIAGFMSTLLCCSVQVARVPSRLHVIGLIGLCANPQTFMERQHTTKADFESTRAEVLLVPIIGKDRGREKGAKNA